MVLGVGVLILEQKENRDHLAISLYLEKREPEAHKNEAICPKMQSKRGECRIHRS